MNAPFSPYLTGIAPGLKQLISLLRKEYDYVSVLSTDSAGFQASISQRSKSVSRETLTTERGTVVRVYRGSLYSEAAFTGFDPEKVQETCRWISRELDSQLRILEACGIQPYETAKLPDGERTIFAEMGNRPSSRSGGSFRSRRASFGDFRPGHEVGRRRWGSG